MARARGIKQFYLPLTRLSTNGMNHPVSIHQMALPERGSAHTITAHYSVIDLERLSLPSWLTL